MADGPQAALDRGRRPTLAFFTPYMPYPPDTGGKNRSYNLLKGLARHFAIDLCTVYHGDVAPDAGPVAALCRSITCLRVPAGRARTGWRESLLSAMPFTVRAFHSQRTLAEAAAALAPYCHDLLFFDEVVMSVYRRYLPPFVPSIVSFQKVDHEFHFDLALRQGGPRRRLYHLLEAIKLLRHEGSALRGARAMVVCSQADRLRLQRRHPSVPAVVTPNGVDVDYYRPGERPTAGPPTMLFVGTMDYQPNIDGLRYFLRKIYGRIIDQIPEAQLVVVGRNPSPAVSALHRPPYITITGGVADMRPYYNAAAVSIVPLRVGGGTRLKIAESLAMGVPVVSTRIGAEGLDAQAGRDLLVADDPAAFANAVVRVLSDARLRTDLAANGRRLVEVKYVWTDLAEELAANLLDIVREGVLDSGRGSR